MLQKMYLHTGQQRSHMEGTTVQHYSIYDIFVSGPRYTCAGWEEHRLYVEHFGTKITCHNVQKQENILVLLFHPRIKFCLPFIHVIHKFQLYMTWSSFTWAFLKHHCCASFPLKTNSLVSKGLCNQAWQNKICYGYTYTACTYQWSKRMFSIICRLRYVLRLPFQFKVSRSRGWQIRLRKLSQAMNLFNDMSVKMGCILSS
jgi:hypothetical protein